MNATQNALDSVANAIASRAAREDVSEKELAILAEAAARIAEADKMASGKDFLDEGFQPTQQFGFVKRPKRKGTG